MFLNFLIKLFQKVYAFIQIVRPVEWSKTFGAMLFAAIAFIYLNNLIVTREILGQFIWAFIIVGPFLWGGLYTLNDYTDREKDKAHSVKKLRPIPSGKISELESLIFSGILILLALVFAFQINLWFFAAVFAMLLNQILYTMPQIRLKELPVIDLISGSIVSPVFRFLCGWFLFSQSFELPILFLTTIVGIQFGGFTLYRLSGKKVEEKLGYKSSSVVINYKVLKAIAYISIVIGITSYFALIFIPLIVPSLIFLGHLPFEYFYYAFLMLIPFPLYYKAMRFPEKMNMKFMYLLLFWHYTIFIIGFGIFFFLIHPELIQLV